MEKSMVRRVTLPDVCERGVTLSHNNSPAAIWGLENMKFVHNKRRRFLVGRAGLRKSMRQLGNRAVERIVM